MREAVGVLIVAGLLAFSSLPSRAQMVSPFGPLGLPLTQEDFSNMSAAVRPLLDDESVPLGTTREWKNPTSGNSGRMTLLDRFETAYQGSKLPCRKIRYHIQIRNVADPYNLEVNRCRAADGSWKIL